MNLLHHYTQIRRTGYKRTLATHYIYWSFCSTVNFYRFGRCDFMTACTLDFDMPFSCDDPLNVPMQTLLIVMECRIMFMLIENAVFDVASWLTKNHSCWEWFSCRMIGFRFGLVSLYSDSCYKGKSPPINKAINFTRLSVYWSVFWRLLNALDKYIYQNKWGVIKSELLLLVEI